MSVILLIIVAWIIGSFPTGPLLARLYKIDLRTVGSGNIGATNVARTLGSKAGLIVLIIDILKGVLAVSALPLFLVDNTVFANTLPYYLALAVTAGHCMPFYNPLAGGKGVATALGSLIACAPLLAIVAVTTFLLAFFFTKFVSLASVLASLSIIPASYYVLPQQSSGALLPITLIALLVLWRHKANITRLLKGTEPKFKKRS